MCERRAARNPKAAHAKWARAIVALAAGYALLPLPVPVSAKVSSVSAKPEGAVVALTTQPGSALEKTAQTLVASDVKESNASGDPPVLLVGSAPLAAGHGDEALFVQVQSASFCGSAGCSTSVYLRRHGGWRKVMDSVSGPIKLSPRTHKGMHDLLLHGGDRWVWNGTAYVDTLPTPAVDLRHSTKE